MVPNLSEHSLPFTVHLIGAAGDPDSEEKTLSLIQGWATLLALRATLETS